MKVLIYRYGSICEPDIISGFETLGFTVSQITAEITNKNLSMNDSIKLVSEFLLDNPQDFIFSINFFPQISEICNIFHIRYVSWIVDSPVMELYTKSIQNTYNRVFIFDREQFNDISPLNPECVFHFPLAVNVEQKQSVITNASSITRRKYTSDVSFVGSLYTEKCPYDKLENVPAYLNGYLNGIMAAQLKIYGAYIINEALTDDIVSQFKTHLPGFYQSPLNSFLTDRDIVSQLYIGNKISALERTQVFDILSRNFSVDLYTGSNTSHLPFIHNRGFAKTLTEMPIIFHESSINLNITSKAIRSGIPLRVFDIFACEGFMLSNYQTELCELFDVGNDFDYYSSYDELVEKTHYYLEHNAIRKEMAHNAYEKVAQKYNYPLRLCELIELAYSK